MNKPMKMMKMEELGIKTWAHGQGRRTHRASFCLWHSITGNSAGFNLDLFNSLARQKGSAFDSVEF